MNGEGNEAETQDAKKHFWKDYEPIEKMSFVLAAFTVVYSVITLGLLVIAKSQVDSIRKDERPWVVEAVQSSANTRQKYNCPHCDQYYESGKNPSEIRH